MQAKIRLWVLTGDKEETAIEIAKSCNLIQPNMEVITIFSAVATEIKETLEDQIKKHIPNDSNFLVLEDIKEKLGKPIALVVNGIALSFILSDNDLSEKFFKLGFISDSCVCCRVSPSQKMLVVKLSKTFGK